MCVWGTCAGAILLSKNPIGADDMPEKLALIDISVARNAYGRQTESFRVDVKFGGKPLRAFFIRAPKITRISAGVIILLKYSGRPVLCRTKNVLLSTFHSEFNYPDVVLEYFLDMVRQAQGG